MSSSNPFRITADPSHVVLDAQRQGEVAFSVSNATDESVRGRAKVVPAESHQAWWLSLEGDAERDFGPYQTLEFRVGIAPPLTAPAGEYSFSFDVLDEAGTAVCQSAVSFEIPGAPAKKPAKKPSKVRLALVATLTAVLLAVGAAAWFLSGAADKKKQRQTVTDTRNVGTAMMNWWADHVRSKPKDFPPASSAGRSKNFTVRKKGELKQSYALVSSKEIEKILVPSYLSELPETDGWGHRYEFAINSNLLGNSVVGVRSPGKDGRFDTDDYEIGSFYPAEFDQDIVFNDGYMARWPSRFR